MTWRTPISYLIAFALGIPITLLFLAILVGFSLLLASFVMWSPMPFTRALDHAWSETGRLMFLFVYLLIMSVMLYPTIEAAVRWEENTKK